MQLYIVKATCNYPDASDIETPDYNGVTQEGAYEFVRRLLKTEPEATSFVVTIVAVSK